MTSQTWSPEPWDLIWHGNERYPYPLSINSNNGQWWITRDGQVSSGGNARRIVACVNACAGIQNPETIKDVVEILKDIDKGVSAFAIRARARAALLRLDAKP